MLNHFFMLRIEEFFVSDNGNIVNLQVLKVPGPTGFDSIVLCRYKHVVRCVISTLI